MLASVRLLATLAWRNLWRHWRRTLLLATAVAVGVALTVVADSFYQGFAVSIAREARLTLPGEIQIETAAYAEKPSFEQAFAFDEAVAQTVAGHPEVVDYVPRLTGPIIVRSEREARGGRLLGVDPARENMTFVGNLDLPVDQNFSAGASGGVVLGAELAESLATDVGKRVVLTAQASSGERVETGARVLGVFRGPNDALERSVVLMALPAAQRFIGLDGRVTDLSLFVADGADNRQVANDLRAPLTRLNADLLVRPWQDHQPLLLFMSQIMGSVGWVARIVVFTALAFGMVNTLLAAVLERRREFGLLLSVGMKPRAILQQVALESWFQLAIALFSGLAVGLVVLHLIGGEIDMTQFSGLGFPGMSGAIVLHYRVLDFVSLCLFLLALGIFVSMYPVRRLLKDGAMAISRRA